MSTVAQHTTNRTQSVRASSLDDLAKLRGAELKQIYQQARLPADLRELHGEPVGRMLAVRPFETGGALGAVARLAAATWFPWGGKNFASEGDGEGLGINRIRVGAIQRQWFPFRTRVEPSVLDDQPCIYLDYEQPGNPFFIAKIRDEIREVRSGLYLGPAMWKDGRGGATTVLWFALDFHHGR